MGQEKADLSKLRVEVVWHEDMWQQIKNAALFTIHKIVGKYPDSKWKRKILRAEHSVIRCGHLIINVYNCPQFVIGHFVRHHNGFTPFVASFRYDRYNCDETPNRNTLQDMKFDGNFQSFINISRKRFCNCASYETRYVWNVIMNAVREFESELADACVRECTYRNGFCPEHITCGFNKTHAFLKELREYQKGFEDQINEHTLIKDEHINEERN